MKRLFALFLLSLLFLADTTAQCSMCKAVVESGGGEKDFQSFGEQLNTGILFLMAIPYIFILAIPLVVFRKQIRGFIREMRGVYK